MKNSEFKKLKKELDDYRNIFDQVMRMIDVCGLGGYRVYKEGNKVIVEALSLDELQRLENEKD